MGGVLYALMHSLVMFVIIGAMPVIFAFVKVPGGATGLTILLTFAWHVDVLMSRAGVEINYKGGCREASAIFKWKCITLKARSTSC